MTTGRKSEPGKIAGVNKVSAKLADGTRAIYYYHRESGTRLEGEYGSPEFIASLAAAQAQRTDRTAGTLAGLIRQFEKTSRWRKLAESTRAEYVRIFKFWDAEYGTLPLAALNSRKFRQDVLRWHGEFAAEKPREADNRVTILAGVLSWGASDGPLKTNVLETFERAYQADRSDMIWLPEHVHAFLDVASPEMQLAMMLALHTGQRQSDILRMAWNNYDGRYITIRQGKNGRRVSIPCTKALKETLDALPRRGAVILTTKTGMAFKTRYFGRRWAEACEAAEKTQAEIADLHFHDVRGTTVTLLFEGGCTVAEAASITGHTLRRAEEILDRYLSRTRTLADQAIAKLENVLSTDFAKRPAKRP